MRWSRLPTSELRREWRRRIIDHDGDGPGNGGIERWLKLTEGVGLDRAYVQSTRRHPARHALRGRSLRAISCATGRSSRASPRR